MNAGMTNKNWLLSDIFGVEPQREVEEHTVANEEGNHDRVVLPGMVIHFGSIKIVQDRLRIRTKEPNHLLQMPILIRNQQLIRVLEGGKIVQPYPVFRNASSTHKIRTLCKIQKI
jgi:hypothetical protein